MDQATQPSEGPTIPHPKELKDTCTEELGVPPILQEANELDATVEEPKDELACLMATVEGYTEELATLTATVGEPAEEPDTPYAAEGRREEEGSRWQLPWLHGSDTSHMAGNSSCVEPSNSGQIEASSSWPEFRRKEGLVSVG